MQHPHPISPARAGRAKRLGVVATLGLLLGAGCVTSGTYEELVAKQNQTQQALEQARSRASSLESDLASATSRGSELAGTVEEKNRALAELRARQAQAQERIAKYGELTAKFRALVDAGKLKVSVVDGRLVVQMQTDVLFGSGSAALSGDGRRAVEEVGALLASLADRRYQIEGHTDNVPIRTKSFPSNWELAAARAITVVQAMVAQGLAPDRVSAVSYGETHPIADNESSEGRAQNRRIEIVVVPDLSLLPGAGELEAISQGS